MHHLWQGNPKQYVSVRLIGEYLFNGIIIDSGSDIVVLFNGDDFIYIPVRHIEYIVANTPDTEFSEPVELPSILSQNLTIDSILIEAKGLFLKICIGHKKYVYGTMVDVLDDYIVLYSPVYKTTYIAKTHLKWLIPSTTNERPYALSEAEYGKHEEKVVKTNFVEQLTEMENKLVIINFGEKIHQIGKIQNVHPQIVELKTVEAESMYLNTDHIKIIYEA